MFRWTWVALGLLGLGACETMDPRESGYLVPPTVAEDASLRDRWSRPFMTTTDEKGRFALPTEIAPAAVIITHADGIAAFRYVDFSSSSEIPLVPWGVIDGQVMWGDEPGVGLLCDHAQPCSCCDCLGG